MARQIVVELSGGKFTLDIDADDGAGSVESNLHYTEDQWKQEFGADFDDPEDIAEYNRYEGAIDGIEAFLLALAQAGVDVTEQRDALQTALDAIGNEL